MKKTPPKSRYSGDKKPLNIILSGELVKLGKKYFPGTRHGSLSGFFESALIAHYRKEAAKIRKGGHVIPEAVFTK